MHSSNNIRCVYVPAVYCIRNHVQVVEAFLTVSSFFLFSSGRESISGISLKHRLWRTQVGEKEEMDDRLLLNYFLFLSLDKGFRWKTTRGIYRCVPREFLFFFFKDSVNTSRQGQREKGEQLGRSREPKNHKTASPLPPRTRRTQQEKITIKKKTNIRTRNYIVEALEIEVTDMFVFYV